MKKSILLSTCLLIAISASAAQDPLLTYGPNDSLQHKLPIGTPSCEFNSIGKYPSFTTVKTIEKEIRIFLCGTQSKETGKRGVVKNESDLENLIVLRKMTDIGGWFKKENVKYEGWRKEAPIGNIIEKILLPKRHFEDEADHAIISAIKRNSVIILTLQNNNWLKGFAANMLKSFIEADFNPTKKSLLVLNLIDDPKLETIDATSREFLTTYFELVDPTNNDIKEFFKDQQTRFFDIKSNMSHCNKYIDENLREGVIRTLEKHFEDFKIKDNLGKIIIAFLTIEMLYNHKALTELFVSQMSKLKGLIDVRLNGPMEPQPQTSTDQDEIRGLRSDIQSLRNVFTTFTNSIESEFGTPPGSPS